MGAASCQHHLDRSAVGICIRCRLPMCDECITKIDGINHCRDCLAELAKAGPPVPERRMEAVWWSWLVVLLSLGALWLLVWIMLTALLPEQKA